MQVQLVKNKGHLYLFIALFVSLFYGCVKDNPFPPTASNDSADVVYDWYRLMMQIQLNTIPKPAELQNIRDLSYVGVGLYEAIQPGIKDARSLSTILYQMPAMPAPEMNKQYSWPVSANAALGSLFRQFLSGLTEGDKARMDSLEHAYDDRFQANIQDDVFKRSQEFGRSIALAIHEWSTSDNFNLSSEGYDIPVFPGAWEKTSPDFANPIGPFVKNSRPFLESSLSATIPPLPIAYSEEPNSKFYAEAEEVITIENGLLDEQIFIAFRWADYWHGPPGYAGGGHLLFIVTDMLQSKKEDLADAAQLYGKTGIAMKESIYIAWKGKYNVNLLRPITYITRFVDPHFQSYLPTPPSPEYPSGLTALYGTSMQILKKKYGDIEITDNAYVWILGYPSKYASIAMLMNSVANSRLYAGANYPFTVKSTLKLAEELGNTIYNLKFIGNGQDRY
jgi:hypothetical protein